MLEPTDSQRVPTGKRHLTCNAGLDSKERPSIWMCTDSLPRHTNTLEYACQSPGPWVYLKRDGDGSTNGCSTAGAQDGQDFSQAGERRVRAGGNVRRT